MPALPKYHIAASGEAVRCRAQKRCRLQHLDAAAKTEYDALFGDVFKTPPRRLLQKTVPRQPLELPGYDQVTYETQAEAFYHKLDDQDRRELTWYTETPMLNTFLREQASIPQGKRDKFSSAWDRAKHLDTAIAKGGFEQPVDVYRGAAFNDAAELRQKLATEYVAGREVSFPEFLSTSINPEVAVSFATGHGSRNASTYQPVLFRITTSEGAPVDMLTDSPIDKEILLPRNKKFRVVKVDHELVENRTIDIDPHDPFDHYADTIYKSGDLHGMVIITLVEA